jgi:hypothetical protein
MEPISMAMAAFAGVQKAVSMIKQAQKTVNDVKSLGPLLGNYFEAKHQTTVALNDAKAKGGSNMGRAIQIEMDLMAQKEFEEELKMLFFQTGNADVWEGIMKRVAEMNAHDKDNARRARDAAMQQAKKMKRMIEYGVATALLLIIAPILLYGAVETIIYCKKYGCGK